MTSQNYWNILFQHHKNPCILADFHSEKVLHYNEEMSEMIDGAHGMIGMNFYDVITNDSSTLGNNPNINWDYSDFFESKIYNKALNQVISVTYIKLQNQAETYILVKYKPVQTTKHFHFTFEEMMSRCITIAQSSEEARVPALLEILGEFYDAEKTFLYQIDKKNQKVPCLAHWRKGGHVPIVLELSDKLEVDKLAVWLDSRNEIGMLEASECHGNFCETSPEGEMLKIFNLENIVICVLEDENGEPFAMVVVSNRKNLSADFRLLQAVARFAESDVSKSEMKSTLTQISALDMLTGFHNRVVYSEKVEKLQKDPCKTLGVAFANVNGLKQVNAEYGLAKGDSYIKKAAEQIKNHFNVDFYRISGDEFVGFFENMDKETFESEIFALQKNAQNTGDRSFSLGHAWGSGRYDVTALIKEADSIMYINKQEYYHSSSKAFENFSDSTLGDLLSYLKNDEFMIYLQPQVHLNDGSLYGAEALIRRYDKTNEKMVFPDQFIPLYEQKSVIRHVDIFVVQKVCQLLQQWGKIHKMIPISVNLSRVTLQEFGIVNTISQICDQYEVPRQFVVIEVTERVGLVENNVASSLINEFKTQGFHISLDDFGCAYSNIVTLAQIEVDEVKIDKSLVDNLVTNLKNRVLVKMYCLCVMN